MPPASRVSTWELRVMTNKIREDGFLLKEHRWRGGVRGKRERRAWIN